MIHYAARMPMPRRNIFVLLVALVVALVCIRLGLWQLDRLDERQARNAAVAAEMSAPPVTLGELDPGARPAGYRSIKLDGTFDFANEFVVTGRTRQGSPGVHIITPLVADAYDRVILVDRGWVYSPDAATVDLTRWREPEQTSIVAYVADYPPPADDNPRSASNPRALRRLDTAYLARTMTRPLAPFYVVALAGREQSENVPVRAPAPALDDGPHRSYAFQWFSFAAIAIIGPLILLRNDRRNRERQPNRG